MVGSDPALLSHPLHFLSSRFGSVPLPDSPRLSSGLPHPDPPVAWSRPVASELFPGGRVLVLDMGLQASGRGEVLPALGAPQDGQRRRRPLFFAARRGGGGLARGGREGGGGGGVCGVRLPVRLEQRGAAEPPAALVTLQPHPPPLLEEGERDREKNSLLKYICPQHSHLRHFPN